MFARSEQKAKEIFWWQDVWNARNSKMSKKRRILESDSSVYLNILSIITHNRYLHSPLKFHRTRVNFSQKYSIRLSAKPVFSIQRLATGENSKIPTRKKTENTKSNPSKGRMFVYIGFIRDKVTWQKYFSGMYIFITTFSYNIFLFVNAGLECMNLFLSALGSSFL